MAKDKDEIVSPLSIIVASVITMLLLSSNVAMAQMPKTMDGETLNGLVQFYPKEEAESIDISAVPGKVMGKFHVGDTYVILSIPEQEAEWVCPERAVLGCFAMLYKQKENKKKEDAVTARIVRVGTVGESQGYGEGKIVSLPAELLVGAVDAAELVPPLSSLSEQVPRLIHLRDVAGEAGSDHLGYVSGPGYVEIRIQDEIRKPWRTLLGVIDDSRSFRLLTETSICRYLWDLVSRDPYGENGDEQRDHMMEADMWVEKLDKGLAP